MVDQCSGCLFCKSGKYISLSIQYLSGNDGFGYPGTFRSLEKPTWITPQSKHRNVTILKIVGHHGNSE